MRVAAEFIYDSSKILIRLLGTSNPISFVQTGTYIVNFSATKAPISYDIDSDQISNNEANIYISNVYPWPDAISVTLPDLTVQNIVINTVIPKPKEEILAPQKLETITPREPAPFQPAEAFYKPDTMALPAFPPYWVEFNFTKANVVKLTENSTSSPLIYTGGGPGRVLSNRVAQTAPNQAPYLLSAPTHLEGAFSNDLAFSDLTTSYLPGTFIDAVPQGWTIQQSDPNSLIRVAINPASTSTLLPNFQIQWYLRPGYQDYSNAPPIGIVTPAVPADETLQILFEVPNTNALGTVQLFSATNVNQSAQFLLSSSTMVSFNVGSDPGPVTIKWQQLEDGSTQSLTIASAISSNYQTSHTYLPFGSSNLPDIVQLTNVAYPKYNFSRGYIRVESFQEQAGYPFSWSIKFQDGSTLLQVQAGILSSDFSSSALNLAALLPTDPLTMGNYKLTWQGSSPQVSLSTKLTGQVETTTALPFYFNLVIPSATLLQSLTYTFSSFAPLAGSSRINYFIFRPE